MYAEPSHFPVVTGKFSILEKTKEKKTKQMLKSLIKKLPKT